VEQVGTPVEIYERPANGFVARFFGSPPMNVFPSDVHPGPHSDTWLGIRPEKVKLRPPGAGDVDGRVAAVEPLGAEAIVHVEVDGSRLLVRELLESAPAVGTPVGLEMHGADLFEFTSRDGPLVP
jgi:multiple sugar transport system ATP-binding protein